jgi:hypothetical protein
MIIASLARPGNKVGNLGHCRFRASFAKVLT